MKLASRDVAGFVKNPRPGTALILLFGPDAMRTAITRQDLMKTLLGPNAEEDMRLTRMTGSDLRGAAAALQDAVKAIGFFPGARGVLITDATDSIAPVVKDALAAWEDGDAVMVIEAGNLGKGSALRKLAEGDGRAVAAGIYQEPPGRAAIEDMCAAAGLDDAAPDAMAALVALAQKLDPGDFRQMLDKLALYTWSQTGPVTAEDVAACGPASTEQGLDDVIDTLANCDARSIGPKLERLAAQGVNPTTLCITATRYFRQLHQAAADPGGPGAGIARLRPPVFGPRRDRMQRQARSWGMVKLERALVVLMDTDLALRSSAHHPAMALAERAFIRIAMMNAPRR